jgi:hypothetical protein
MNKWKRISEKYATKLQVPNKYGHIKTNGNTGKLAGIAYTHYLIAWDTSLGYRVVYYYNRLNGGSFYYS